MSDALTAEALPQLGFYQCTVDLEDELIRALGVQGVEAVIEAVNKALASKPDALFLIGYPGDGTTLARDVVDARCRHVQRHGQCMGTQPQGTKELFAQHFARVDWAHAVRGTFHGTSPCSVVVDDLHVEGITAVKSKTHAPLIIDADAVLPKAVMLQRLKPVVGRHTQIIQSRCPIEHLQFPLGHGAHVDPALDPMTTEQGCGVLALEPPDHHAII